MSTMFETAKVEDKHICTYIIYANNSQLNFTVVSIPMGLQSCSCILHNIWW